MLPPLAPAPFPASNPLVGLVPYAGEWKHAVPHSMEFSYFAMGRLAPAPGQWNWTPVDEFLITVARRGHQAIFRFYLEYPGQTDGLSTFLREAGVPVTDWTDNDGRNLTPDYRDPRVRGFIRDFVTALAKRYDGDPRIGFLTMGTLGKWGEWHTWPKTELFPPAEVETEVMDVWQAAFRKTPVLMRYPTALTKGRPFGYHDDSFAFGTLPVPGSDSDWHFMTQMRKVGEQNKWRTHPIGGEIRPEAWGICFDEKPSRPDVQNFDACVDATRVSWLMDSGMFSNDKPLDPVRKARAIRSVSRMGYVPRVLSSVWKNGVLTTRVTNLGVAPFYADWPTRLARVDRSGRLVWSGRSTGRLKGLMPGAVATWRDRVPAGSGPLLLSIPNPMPGGMPVRFANAGQDRHRSGWLTIRQ